VDYSVQFTIKGIKTTKKRKKKEKLKASVDNQIENNLILMN
jgi:hypothetical protein